MTYRPFGTMTLNLLGKLFLALFVSMLVILALMMGSVQWSFRTGFADYLEQVRQQRLNKIALALAQAYGQHDDSWDFIYDDPEDWSALIGHRRHPHHKNPGHADWHSGHPPSHPPPPLLHTPSPEGFKPPPHRDRPEDRLRLLDAHQNPITGPPHPVDTARETLYPIEVGGRVIGWLAFIPNFVIGDELENSFIRQQFQANLLILGLVFVVSVLASFLLARQIVLPVRTITGGARQLAAGRYDMQIEPRSGDELGELAQHFNFLARTLKENETARRRWLADISHELRTPLTILRGEIEALLDGIHSPEPERLESLLAESIRLGHLVDDLHQLSLHDLGALTYRMETIQPLAVLREVIRDLEPRYAEKQLSLSLSVGQKSCTLLADADRLRQLFLNILENTYRYTDAGGFCRVSFDCSETEFVVDFEDTSPGVPENLHSRLFERLFRVDHSRNRASGGSGLGLAICKGIVDALGGDIEARPSRYGGLWISIRLKRAGPSLTQPVGANHD